MLKLMYITKDEEKASIAEKAGVERIFIDLEKNGKEKRQGHLSSVKSDHTFCDIKKVKEKLLSAEVLVRINPFWEHTPQEIEKSIDMGADIIMLPYFTSVKEAESFLKVVNRRIKTVLLVETYSAVRNIDKILSISEIDEVYVGLNDLSLSSGYKFLFSPLSKGLVEKVAVKANEKAVPFGFGGLARIGEGTVSSEKILAEHIRLGSTSVILSRSFCPHAEFNINYQETELLFIEGIKRIREKEKELSLVSKEVLEEKKIKLYAEIDEIERKL